MVTNFAVYEDATEYLGLAEVEFPEIGFLTEEISGAGMSGKIEAIVHLTFVWHKSIITYVWQKSSVFYHFPNARLTASR